MINSRNVKLFYKNMLLKEYCGYAFYRYRDDICVMDVGILNTKYQKPAGVIFYDDDVEKFDSDALNDICNRCREYLLDLDEFNPYDIGDPEVGYLKREPGKSVSETIEKLGLVERDEQIVHDRLLDSECSGCQKSRLWLSRKGVSRSLYRMPDNSVKIYHHQYGTWFEIPSKIGRGVTFDEITKKWNTETESLKKKDFN